MNLTELLIILLQIMLIGRLSELSEVSDQNYGQESGWQHTQTIEEELPLFQEEFIQR